VSSEYRSESDERELDVFSTRYSLLTTRYSLPVPEHSARQVPVKRPSSMARRPLTKRKRTPANIDALVIVARSREGFGSKTPHREVAAFR